MDFYKGLLGSTSHVFYALKVDLDVLEAEIRNIIFTMKSNKAPVGPNGFPVEFYKAA